MAKAHFNAAQKIGASRLIIWKLSPAHNRRNGVHGIAQQMRRIVAAHIFIAHATHAHAVGLQMVNQLLLAPLAHRRRRSPRSRRITGVTPRF